MNGKYKTILFWLTKVLFSAK